FLFVAMALASDHGRGAINSHWGRSNSCRAQSPCADWPRRLRGYRPHPRLRRQGSSAKQIVGDLPPGSQSLRPDKDPPAQKNLQHPSRDNACWRSRPTSLVVRLRSPSCYRLVSPFLGDTLSKQHLIKPPLFRRCSIVAAAARRLQPWAEPRGRSYRRPIEDLHTRSSTTAMPWPTPMH